ncbi:MAG TPA: MFS transporter [Stellaceae bacterium]|nr:MFS transporter [Stellaceae bacterium]
MASDVHAQKVESRLLIAATTALFLSTLDTGIVTLAVVPLANALGASPATASWTVTAYALAVSVALLPAGWLADRLGSLRVFRVGIGVFAAASLLCAAVPSMSLLIGARVFQGCAAALIQATAPALIAGLSPARQAAGYGWLSVAAGLGVVLGPPVAGLLLSIDGWRLLFLINLPVSAVAYALATGANVPARVSAWLRPSRRVVAAMIGSSALGASTAIILIVPPAVLHGTGLPVWLIGLVGLLAPLGQVIVARATGTVITRRGPMLPFFAGLAIMLASVAGLAVLGVKLEPGTYALLLLFGFGSGLFQPAGFASALAGADPQERARIGALVRLATNLGIAAGGWLSAAGGSRPWEAAAILIVVAAALAAALDGLLARRLAARS